MTDFLLFIVIALLLMFAQFAVIGGSIYWMSRVAKNLAEKLDIVSEHARVFERVEARSVEILDSQKKTESFIQGAEAKIEQMLHNYELRIKGDRHDDLDGSNYTEV